MKQKQKWEEDDTCCKGYILGGLSDTLYDVYEIKYANSSAKELWDDLDNKYETEDTGNKKFLISKLFDFHMENEDTVDEDQVHPTPDMGEGGELRRSKRARIGKTYGSDFYQFLVERSRNEGDYSHMYNVEHDPLTYREAITSRDSDVWQEAINHEMESIISDQTWGGDERPHQLCPRSRSPAPSTIMILVVVLIGSGVILRVVLTGGSAILAVLLTGGRQYDFGGGAWLTIVQF
ncbi:hypothetical protein RJ639_035320 [Escallonia herrerae]|uniref:Zinc finger, CCHC-type n=1 Tax=Escallonia herrerae TaxID=1293975 RepID=A0AA88WX73_9ASTE|nr:hypothetical protein RJ639_035320 [Escallonia herrerae]